MAPSDHQMAIVVAQPVYYMPFESLPYLIHNSTSQTMQTHYVFVIYTYLRPILLSKLIQVLQNRHWISMAV